MLRTRIAITAGAAALALSSPAVAGADHAPHSPDALDRATAAQTVRNPQPPDARDRALAAQAAPNPQPPDARDRALAAEAARLGQDAALPAETVRASGPAADAVPPAPATQPGFRWGDAGIGAAGMLGLVCAVGAALALLPLQRRGRVALLRQ